MKNSITNEVAHLHSADRGGYLCAVVNVRVDMDWCEFWSRFGIHRY